MEKYLEELISIKGVIGVLVGNPSGRILARVKADAYENSTAAKLTKPTALLINSYSLATHNVEEIDVCFESIRVVARGLKDTCVLVICEPDVDISMVRLTLNVVLAKISKDAKVMQGISEREVLS